MASWFGHYSKEQNFISSLCYKILSQGQIPKHVAIIMDGNRRFAKKENISRKEGHTKGFEKLTELLYWCYELDIPEVTVYAFSTENFKRSKEEVETLMKIFESKLQQLLQEEEMLTKYEVNIRFLGDISLFTPKIRTLIAKVLNMCKDNDRSFLNIATAYTSREEITQAMRSVAEGVRDGMIKESDINEELLENCFYTSKCKPVDMLIRTSGEVRLSDFLLWQTSFSILCFVDALWPDFTLWHFFYCVLKFQLGYNTLENAKELSKLKESRAQMESDLRCAHAELTTRDIPTTTESLDQSKLNKHVKQYTEQRIKRQDDFLRRIEQQRNDKIAACLKNDTIPEKGYFMSQVVQGET